MTPDVHAAAERLRKHYEAYAAAQGEPAAKADEILEGSPYFYGGSATRWASVQMTCDYKTLADAYLSEHPASDANAITAERLEALGFDYRHWLILRDDETTVTLILMPSGPLGWRALIAETGEDDNGECESQVLLPFPLRTLGDVRKLLIGLGYSVAKETT